MWLRLQLSARQQFNIGLVAVNPVFLLPRQLHHNAQLFQNAHGRSARGGSIGGKECGTNARTGSPRVVLMRYVPVVRVIVKQACTRGILIKEFFNVDEGK